MFYQSHHFGIKKQLQKFSAYILQFLYCYKPFKFMLSFNEILSFAFETEYQEPSNLFVNKLQVFKNGRLDCLSENDFGSCYQAESYFIPSSIAQTICGQSESTFVYR